MVLNNTCKCMQTLCRNIYGLVYTYTHMHVHIHTHTCIHIYMYTYTYTYTYIHTWIHTHTHTHIHVHIHIYIYIYIYLYRKRQGQSGEMLQETRRIAKHHGKNLIWTRMNFVLMQHNITFPCAWKGCPLKVDAPPGPGHSLRICCVHLCNRY